MTDALKQELASRAQAEGFARMGICAPDAIPQAAARLDAFLAGGMHGQMGWMAERSHWRGNPAALWPEAQSVIMLAEVYTPEGDPLAGLARPDRGIVSSYAQGKDYHDLVKRRLKRLGRWLIDRAGGADQGLRRYCPGDGKALGAGGGSGLAGQAHQPSGPRSGKLVLSGRHLHDAGPAPRRGRGQPLRQLHRLP